MIQDKLEYSCRTYFSPRLGCSYDGAKRRLLGNVIALLVFLLGGGLMVEGVESIWGNGDVPSWRFAAVIISAIVLAWRVRFAYWKLVGFSEQETEASD